MKLTSDLTLPLGIATDKQAQRWLDIVPLPENGNLDVCFRSLDVSAQYLKKLTLSIDKKPLESFAAQIRSDCREIWRYGCSDKLAKEE